MNPNPTSLTAQNSPKMMERLSSERRHDEVGEKAFEDSRELVKSNGDDLEDPMASTMDVDQEHASAPLLLAGKTEKEFEGRAQAPSMSKQSGKGFLELKQYCYGRGLYCECSITFCHCLQVTSMAE